MSGFTTWYSVVKTLPCKTPQWRCEGRKLITEFLLAGHSHQQWDWCLVSWQSHYNWDKELTIVFLSLSVSAGDCAHCQRDNHWFSITCEELTPGRWSGGGRVMVVPAQSDLLCNTGHWHGPQSPVRLDANIASPSSTVERSVSITYHKIPPLSWHLSSDCEGRERWSLFPMMTSQLHTDVTCTRNTSDMRYDMTLTREQSTALCALRTFYCWWKIKLW